jgi:hypothetical protein
MRVYERVFAILIVLLLRVHSACALTVPAGPLRFGAAKVDITHGVSLLLPDCCAAPLACISIPPRESTNMRAAPHINVRKDRFCGSHFGQCIEDKLVTRS